MTKEEIAKIIENSKEYIENVKISQAAFAKKLGVSESTISVFLKGTYKNEEGMAQKAKEFLEKEEARGEVSSVYDMSFCKTSVSCKILNILEYSRIQKTVGLIYGDAGIGKTFTCSEYAKGKSDIIMLTINPVFASTKPFLKMLAKKLKVNARGGSDEILMEIYDALYGSEKCIIIDEAQHLHLKTIETIRSINDITKTAIVLVGNESIHSKMYGKYEKQLSQLFSRITMGGGHALLTDMFTKDDIDMIFPGLQTDAASFLLDISRSRHGLRGAVYTYINSANNNNLSLKGIKAMASLMGICPA